MALIEINNLDGYVLINDEYSNWVIAQQGVLSFTGTTVQTRTVAYYQPNGRFPLIAILPTNGKVGVRSVVFDGTYYTFHLTGEANASCEFFIFHLPQNVPDAGGLVKLWNASGELVFDSNLKYLRVQSFQLTLSTDALAWAVPAGRKYAICCMTPMFANFYAPVGPFPPPNIPYAGQANLYGFVQSGSTIQGSMFTTNAWSGVENNTNAGWNYTNTRSAIMLIDVTNM